MATIAERIEMAEADLCVAAEETRAAWRAYQAADHRQDELVAELKELRKAQRREGQD